MLKKLFSLVVVCFICSAAFCFAAETVEKGKLGLSVLGEVDYYSFGNGSDYEEVHGAPIYKLGLGYDSNYFGLNTKIGYGKTSVYDKDWGFNSMSLNLIPLELNARGQFPLLQGKLIPYVEGGIAYTSVYGDVHDDVKPHLEAGDSLSIDLSPCVGYQVMVGAEYKVVSSVSVFAQGGCSWAKTKYDWKMRANGEDESGTDFLSLNSAVVGGGIKFNF